MTRLLWQQHEHLLAKYDQAILATCDKSGPHASAVGYVLRDGELYLFLPHMSDHLFNLQAQPEVVLLSPEWNLHGRGTVEARSGVEAPHTWQMVVHLHPVRLHILTSDGSGYAETIDFEEISV